MSYEDILLWIKLSIKNLLIGWLVLEGVVLSTLLGEESTATGAEAEGDDGDEDDSGNETTEQPPQPGLGG